jgi:hypothetical protein
MNDMVVDNITQDIGEAVRSTAILVDVTISMWGGERSDATLMDKIKTEAGATGNIGRTMKNMLAGADGLLKDTKSAFAAVRVVHYSMTLPWVSDPHAERQRGPRLLPNMLWDRYTSTIAAKRTTAYLVRDKFINEYPALVEQARANLGTLADANYPDAEDIRAQFKISFDFEPIPAGVAFKGLPDRVIGKLAENLQKKQERMIATAQASMWEEVHDRVKRLHARLSDPEAKFHASTVEAVRDLVVLLPGWNICNNAHAIEVASTIEELLHGLRADDLRSDTRVRANVANQTQAVLDKMAAWGL